MTWFKWWKSRFFMKLLGIAFGSVALAYAFCVLGEWGWIPAILVTIVGGLWMRKIIIKKLEEIT